jgi:hypothetical protein
MLKRYALFWGITQRRVVIVYRRFGRMYLSHLEGSRIPSWPLKMGPISCPETSVNNYNTTPRNTPEERISLCLCSGGVWFEPLQGPFLLWLFPHASNFLHPRVRYKLFLILILSPSLFYLPVHSRCRGFLWSFIWSHSDTQHSRWDSSGRGIGPSQRPLPDNTNTVQDKHPWSRWDSNPRSQQALGRRPTS